MCGCPTNMYPANGTTINITTVPDSRYEFDEDEAEEKKKDVLNQEISDDEAIKISESFIWSGLTSMSISQISSLLLTFRTSIFICSPALRPTSLGLVYPSDVSFSSRTELSKEWRRIIKRLMK